VVIEDDTDTRALIVVLLGQAGFVVHEAATAAAGLELVLSVNPDLITLDLGLPDLDGIEACRQIRAITDAYIVMVTARPDEIDRLMGLEIGADDYLTKPFSPRELRARVGAMLRRPRSGTRRPTTVEDEGVLKHGEIWLDAVSRTVQVSGAELELTRTEFDLLATMMSEPRRVWPRETLLRRVWGSEWVTDGHLVEVHMGNLRRKLGEDSREARHIRTVRGVGYRMATGRDV